jgi:ATP-dependent Lon protease
MTQEVLTLPVLPLRDVVVYPHMIIPLFVGRAKSVLAIEASMAIKQKIFVVAQQASGEEEPSVDNLYKVGTIATILQLLRLPDGTLKVLVEGGERAIIAQYLPEKKFLQAELTLLPDEKTFVVTDPGYEALLRSLVSQFDHYVKLNRKIPPEIISALSGIEDAARLVDTVAAHMTLKIEERQRVLENRDLKARINLLMSLMEGEIDVLQIEKKIRGRVKKQMEKNQHEYYLNEQLKAIQKEMGELSGEGETEVERLEKKIQAAKMPKQALDKALSELKKLKTMSPMAAEASVSRNYIDWLLQVPWHQASKIKKDLPLAEKILNDDHYGLEKVKERILEHLAVQQRVSKMKGPILCLVGPPGVGKTSLGTSIAKATGRKFIRMALGGVRDEAEIRGHRRTYIGSLPGKIIQKLASVGTKNPLFLLDEIDKMTTDSRGDPSSALLEVLDPEQNHAFSDHYLEVDYDLSDVMFVATANSMDIPLPLLDRMEVIRLAGYTEDEKLQIAKRYLMEKHRKSSGLKPAELKVDDSVMLDIIRYYTREAGVRSLEREIDKLCRKIVKEILLGKMKRIHITSKNVEAYLGVKRFRYGMAEEANQVGQVTGLAWTEVGGELLTIEAAAIPGKGATVITGKLGEVMQESIKAAITVVRSRAQVYGIANNFYEKFDLHIHVPEGATPKDGPSAGAAMCTALVSVLSGIPVCADVAMTGEITLRGEVLPIGGLKEKLLAARRGGIKTVLIPAENERDLKEIPTTITDALRIVPVRWIDQVLDIALAQKVKTKVPNKKKNRITA